MKHSVYFLLILSSFYSIGQNFTWMRGSTSNGTITGVYGTQGIASSANDPGSRHGAATWRDNSGNLWLFGGEGISSSPTLSWLNDLWKYNVNTNEWTWIRGSNMPNASGVYGTMGVASAANEPGAREFSASWTDVSGNFWLFGGDGFASTSTFGRLGDLWKYNPTTNEWTWMKGFNTVDQNGVYGIVNVSSGSNNPGARYWPCTWEDGGNLWMFGGMGFPATGNLDGHLNDLWKYNISNNEWTWVAGGTGINTNGVYGTQFTPSTSNMPGGREFGASWKDAAGKFYLMGGIGLASALSPGNGYLNDLWKYDPNTGAWTWLTGASITNQYGQYGTLGVPSTSNTPGGRYGMASWVDLSNNLWLFGGTGWATSTTSNMNDLWKYNLTTHEWTWVKGSNTTNQAGVYGSMAIASPGNIPGARHYITHWKTNTLTLPLNTQFWLFGGDGIDAAGTGPHSNMNDLWVFAPPCANPDSLRPAPASTLCAGNQSINLLAYDKTPGGLIQWYTLPNGGSISVATGSVLSVPGPQVAGTYTYYAETNFCSTVPRTMVVYTVYPIPTITITPSHTLLCGNFFQTSTITAAGASTYSWSTGSTLATIVFTPSPLGSTPNPTLTVTGKNAGGCQLTKTLTLQVVICEGISEESDDNYLRPYPNPSKGVFSLSSPLLLLDQDFTLFNSLGQKVLVRKLTENDEAIKVDLPSGVYFYQLSYRGTIRNKGKLVIE